MSAIHIILAFVGVGILACMAVMLWILFPEVKATPRKTAAPPQSPLLAKDPMDWTLTDNSTAWKQGTYCDLCKHETDHDERMTEICNSCGGHMVKWNARRSFRQIWNGQKWVWQMKYDNGPKGYELLDEFPK